jgi:hypothetical protein
MFKWINKILGRATVPNIIEEVFPEEIPAEPKPKASTKKKATTNKTTTKKKGSGKCDFDKLTKTQLLKEAKQRGVKANASLSKSEILSRLKA